MMRGRDGERPVGNLDLGIVGNCQYSSLIDRRAAVVWCCLPRFDASPVFAGLLDPERGGVFSVQPLRPFVSTQQYLRNTCVLSTRFDVEDGSSFEVVDFAPRFYQFDRYFMPPCLIRVLRPLRGMPRVAVRCDPHPDHCPERGEPTARTTPIAHAASDP